MASENSIETFYECGPGKVLAGFGKRIDKALNVVSVSEFEHLAE